MTGSIYPETPDALAGTFLVPYSAMQAIRHKKLIKMNRISESVPFHNYFYY